MGKILKFEKSNKILLKQTLKEAEKEFAFLFKISGGQPGMVPRWLLGMNKEEYKHWYDGDIEI